MFDELGGTDAVVGATGVGVMTFTLTFAAIKSDKFELIMGFDSVSAFGFVKSSSAARDSSVRAFSMESFFSTGGFSSHFPAIVPLNERKTH